MTCIFCAEPKIQFPRYEENAERGGKNNKNDVDVALLSLARSLIQFFVPLRAASTFAWWKRSPHNRKHFQVVCNKNKRKIADEFHFFAAASSASCGTRQWAEFRDISMGIML